VQWSAAAVTAVALYALPWTLVFALTADVWWGFPALAVDVAALGVVAWLRWSPLVVLGAALLSLGGSIVFVFITAAGQICGDSGYADPVSWIGGVTLAVPLGALGVRRGPWALAAIPAGWAVAGAWFVLVAHVVPGGTGGCFE
jgi:hypothetical protein